jgi:hypothetical protein
MECDRTAEADLVPEPEPIVEPAVESQPSSCGATIVLEEFSGHCENGIFVADPIGYRLLPVLPWKRETGGCMTCAPCWRRKRLIVPAVRDVYGEEFCHACFSGSTPRLARERGALSDKRTQPEAGAGCSLSDLWSRSG